MADDNVNEKENEELNEDEKSKEKPAAGKRKLAMPILIVAAVIGLGALGGGGWFLYSTFAPSAAEAVEGEEEEPSEEVLAQTNIFFDGFFTNIVNLEVSADYPFMYLKYAFEVEVESAAVMSEIAEMQPRLESRIATVISNRNWTEISTAQGRDRLARDCLRKLNDELSSGECLGLYFTTFVAQ